MATFRAGQKTHQAVLPQQLALELGPADNPGIRDETGAEDRTAVPGAGHGREETTTASPGGGGVTLNRPVEEPPRERHPFVFVLDKHGTPLQPRTAARARKLLKKGRAVVHHTVQGIRHKHVRLLQRADGYAYTTVSEHSEAILRRSASES